MLAARRDWWLMMVLVVCAPALQAQANDTTVQRIQRLERALDNKGLLDLVRQLELLQAEVRQLRGELENQIFALEQQRKSQSSAYVDLDQRLGALEQGGVITVLPGQNNTLPGVAAEPAFDPPLPTLAAPGDNSIAGAPAGQAMALNALPPATPAAGAPAPAPALAPAPVPAPAAINAQAVPTAPAPAAAAAAAAAGSAVVVDAARPVLAPAAPTIDSAASEAAYREAFGMLKAGQYDDSIAAFNAYLQQYPASQYADNAQYWLGEAFYVKRQFEPAIEQYRKLVQNYPASKKQSHALLKIAYSHDELGQPGEAVAVLNTLKTRFPGSAAARLADERLQRLRAATP